MTDKEIAYLKPRVKLLNIYWIPDEDTARQVIGIGKHIGDSGDSDDEPEPSEVAFFRNGEYVALYNCEIDEFAQLKKISKKEANWVQPPRRRNYSNWDNDIFGR